MNAHTCHLGRAGGEEYEERGEKRGGEARTVESRKGNKGSRGEVEGMGTLIAEALPKITPTAPLD